MMLTFFNSNEINIKVIDKNYKKMQINFLFILYNYIIYIEPSNKSNYDNILNIKRKVLNLNLLNLNLNNKYIKALFNLSNFSFLKGDNYLCIFINSENSFINIIKELNNIKFFYSYKKSFSEFFINNNKLIEYYLKYNIDYIFIQLQFILKKIKIKIIFLFLFFLISLIKYIQ
jgi:hypothetical protein